MVAIAFTVAFEGVEARLVEVQASVSAGLPSFGIVGLPDKAVSEARANPSKEQVLRAYAAQHTTMENANALAAKAIRTCGGQAMLKSLPLERIYRDSRCGSLMLPWTAEICLDRLGRAPPGRVLGRVGVGVPLREVGQHGRDHARVGRRRAVVVEVDGAPRAVPGKPRAHIVPSPAPDW